jgi:hypothetical protein
MFIETRIYILVFLVRENIQLFLSVCISSFNMYYDLLAIRYLYFIIDSPKTHYHYHLYLYIIIIIILFYFLFFFHHIHFYH